jgi:hypothetical protein
MVRLSNLSPKSFPWDISQSHEPPDAGHNHDLEKYGTIDNIGSITYVPNHRFWLEVKKTPREEIKRLVAVVNSQKIPMKKLDVRGLLYHNPSEMFYTQYWYCDSPSRCNRSYDYFFVAKVTKPLSPHPTTEEISLPSKASGNLPKPFHASVAEWGKISWFHMYGPVKTGDGSFGIWGTQFRTFYIQNLSKDRVSLDFLLEPQPLFSIYRTDPPHLIPMSGSMLCGDCWAITVKLSEIPLSAVDEPYTGTLTLTAKITGTNQTVMQAKMTLYGCHGPL